MKVFLGGTVADTTWRNYMMPKLEVDYFNPVVEVWTEEDQAREIFEREHCEFCLYVLSPKMIGWYSIAEVIDDSYKKPDRTIFCYLKEDEDKKFTEEQLNDLEIISKSVTANGGIIKNSLDEVIEFLNSSNNRKNTIIYDDSIINDVFISYGRRHSLDFATRLHNKLVENNQKVWFDQNDIPLGVDFQQQIDDGIRRANNFIFIISPHSVKSIYCLKEVVLALKYKKRIIPILHIEPSDCWDQMHPAIEKLNWIYFREQEDFNIPLNQWKALDSFDKAYEGLLDLLQQHREYLQQHTLILDKALRWENGQKRTNFLLVGNERSIAEKWLLQKNFTNIKGIEVQAPTSPTHLHAEYICESKKNGENLMTDVFFSFDKNDLEAKITIQNVLHLNYITTWDDNSDNELGRRFDKNIEKGIEEATTFLFLISNESLKSEICISELQYAVKLKKRIISVLLEKVDEGYLPASLLRIEYIDFTDRRENKEINIRSHKDVEADVSARKEKSPFEKGMAEILVSLSHQNKYYEKHKVYLVQALKWERQKRNPSILLRGFNLENARTWLQIGESKKNKPSKIHREFIAESEAKAGMLDSEVFISYSRVDSDFSRKLNDELQLSGKTTWFDQESIASSANFQEEIFKGIEVSHNFLFIISPDSISSPFCKGEVEHARKNNKRIITLLLHETNPNTIPDALSKVQWIDFEKTDYHTSYSELLRTLDIDREYVQKHTRYAQEALLWEKNNRENESLIRGKELVIAESWLTESNSGRKQPAPTNIQIEFIEASKNYAKHTLEKEQEQQNRLIFLERQKAETAEAARKRQRIFLILMGITMLIAVAFGMYGFSQRNKANDTLKRLETEQFNKHFVLAEKSFEQEEYMDAIKNYKEAENFKSNEELTAKIENCQKILEQKQNFDILFEKASKLYDQGFLLEGLKLLIEAEGLNYKSKFIRREINKKAKQSIENCRKTSNTMLEIRLYKEHKYYKQKADSIEILAKEFLDSKDKS